MGQSGNILSNPPPLTAPSKNPEDVYPSPPDFLKGVNFGISYFHSLTEEERKEALGKTLHYMKIQQSNFLGYQCNQNLDFADEIAPYLNMSANNVGDPFIDGSFTINSKHMERAILDYYASLWNAKWPHEDANCPQEDNSCTSEEIKRRRATYWGFSLTMGSTEANMYALWNARDYLSGKALIWEEIPTDYITPATSRQPRLVLCQATLPVGNNNAYTPVIFYSEDTHYSFAKATRLIGISTFYEVGMAKYPNDCPLPIYNGHGWPQEVPSTGGGLGEGTIDIDALVLLVEFFASKGYPILVSFNYGSTFKGAYDDVEKAGEMLMPIMKKYGLYERNIDYAVGKSDMRTGFWIHVDGALGASYMPFIEMAYANKRIEEKGPVFDFRLPFVHSISMSGHKWVGSPMPCGIFMSKTGYQIAPPSRPDYIGSPDTTFAGSRNGLSPIILWHQLSRLTFENQMDMALASEAKANYAYKALQSLEKKLDRNLWVARSKLALTIRFRQANSNIVRKYSLSNETLEVKIPSNDIVQIGRRPYSHIFIMSHVTKEMIDALIDDLSMEGAFTTSLETKAPDMKMFMDTPLISAQQLASIPYVGRGFSG